MPNNTPIFLSFQWLLKNPVCFLGFGFGSGLAKIAPGTFGTLIALPLAAIITLFNMPFWIEITISCIFIITGIPICQITEKKLGIPDYGGIVWDEIAAMFFILMLIPFSFVSWGLAFTIFRILDAWKPWPIRWFDRHYHGGFGIMLDDIIAALLTLPILQIIIYYSSYFTAT